MEKNLKPFGKIRSLLFPIYRHEIKKLIPLSLIFLCVSMTYTMLRGLKDIYVLKYMTADSIYLIKILVIPSIILFTFLYTHIAKRVDGYTRFNVVFGYFLAFVVLFTFVLLPNCELLKLNYIADKLNGSFPRLKALWDAIRVWPISLLYIHAEAYGTMALGVAFWTFANSIFSSIQAKRMYGFLSTGAAIGCLLSGVIMLKYSKATKLLFIVAIFSLIFIVVVYNVLVGRIKADPDSYGVEEKPVKTKSKVKLTFIQSIKCLLKSRYLCFLTLIVLGYNMFIALLESIWKGKVGAYGKIVGKKFLEDHVDQYDIFTGAPTNELIDLAKEAGSTATATIYAWQSICTGILSLFLIFFVAGSMSRKSWKVRALFTPITAFVFSMVFYLFFKKMDLLSGFANMFDKPLLLMFILFGMGILVFIKSSKYIFFDTSKEQAYIPLSEEEKVNGKAAIDAIGSRLGKGMSSIVISVLVAIFGGLNNISGMTFVVVFVIIALWLFAVLSLNPLYEKKLLENSKKNDKEVDNDKNNNAVPEVDSSKK